MTSPRTLYPTIEPYATGRLPVSPLHTLWYEESGNPEGVPVVFLHGGPGGGTGPNMRRFFDPAHYRIVLFDQRGCGRSTPRAELAANTTWDLVDDIERLRVHLGIERWFVFGGSWGSTLALAYAERHPERVHGLVLRGIFLLRRFELEWFYQSGASLVFPDLWEDFLAPIPEVERGDLISAYHRRLTGEDPAARLAAARAWARWEARTSFLRGNADYVASFDDDAHALEFARIESHYFVNGGFLETEDQLLRDAHRLAGIPGVIVHGRYDLVCPLRSAWDLKRAWPAADLRIVPDAGHSAFEPGNTAALVEAMDAFRELGR
jgi:proline iminopeptidase